MDSKAVRAEEKIKPPRSVWLRWASVGLGGLGLVVSLYLTWIKVANTTAFCGGVGDCESVNASRYSEIGGIPIALMGAAVYAVILILLLTETRGDFWQQWAPVGVFGLSFAGMLYSAYLTYIELAVLHAVCPYCVASAMAITSIVIVSVVRLWWPDPE